MAKKNSKNIIFWTGIVFSLVIACMTIWSIVTPRKVLKIFGWKDDNEVGTLTVKKITPGILKKIITVKGRVQSYQEITITSQVSGEIKRLFYKEGEVVKKDCLLVEIDPKTLVEDLATSKSRLEQAKLALMTLKIRKQENEEKMERSERLFHQKLSSFEDMQSLRYTLAMNKIEIDRAHWQIKEMEGEVASIEKKLAQTKITSPLNGVVTKLIVKEGEGVIQGLVNTNGTAIMKISDMSQKGVTVWMSEADVPFLKAGQPVTIQCPNFRDRTFEGHLLQVAMTGQPESYTDLTKFEVKTLFNEPYPELLLEMSAVVSIEVCNKENVLKVPLAAIQTEEKHRSVKSKTKPGDETSEISYHDFVFVIEDGKLSKRYVTTGLSNENEAEILDGLFQEQLVVVGPTKWFLKLEDGKEAKWEEDKAEPAHSQDKKKHST